VIILDCEVYRNYFLLSALHVESGKTKAYEMYDGHDLDVSGIRALMQRNTTVGFNSKSYDLPIITAAVNG